MWIMCEVAYIDEETKNVVELTNRDFNNDDFSWKEMLINTDLVGTAESCGCGKHTLITIGEDELCISIAFCSYMEIVGAKMLITVNNN